MINKFILAITLLTSILITSCSNQSTSDPVQIINTYTDDLKIEYYEGKYGDTFGSINVLVANESNNCYVFPYDYGVTLQIKINDRWDQIPSIATNYSSQDDIIMERKDKSIFDTYPISINPDYSMVKISKTTELKANIKGHLCDHPEITVEKEIPFYAEP